MDGRPGIRAERATAAFQFIQKRRHIVHRSFEIKAATGCKPDRHPPCALSLAFNAFNFGVDPARGDTALQRFGNGFRAPLRTRRLITAKAAVDTDQQRCRGRFGSRHERGTYASSSGSIGCSLATVRPISVSLQTSQSGLIGLLNQGSAQPRRMQLRTVCSLTF